MGRTQRGPRTERLPVLYDKGRAVRAGSSVIPSKSVVVVLAVNSYLGLGNYLGCRQPRPPEDAFHQGQRREVS